MRRGAVVERKKEKFCEEREAVVEREVRKFLVTRFSHLPSGPW